MNKGRKGPRTKEQRLRELLKSAKTSSDKYNIGGRLKEKGYKPRPITLVDYGTVLNNKK